MYTTIEEQRKKEGSLDQRCIQEAYREVGCEQVFQRTKTVVNMFWGIGTLATIIGIERLFFHEHTPAELWISYGLAILPLIPGATLHHILPASKIGKSIARIAALPHLPAVILGFLGAYAYQTTVLTLEERKKIITSIKTKKEHYATEQEIYKCSGILTWADYTVK